MHSTITTFAGQIVLASFCSGYPWMLAATRPAAQVQAPRTRRKSSATPFIWPKSVPEFLLYDPKYLDKWLVSRKCPPALVEDFRQDLFAHLCGRTKECIEKGIPDKMGLYNPELNGNATTVAAWANWLTGYLLINEYSKLIAKQKRGHTAGVNVISLTEDEADTDSSCPTWWKLMEPSERKQFETGENEVYSQVTSSMLMKELLDTAEEEVGLGARQTLDAMAQTDTITQAAELLGVRPRRVHQIMKDAKLTLSSVLEVNAKPLIIKRAPATAIKQA